MSLATRCTACGTVFRVVQDQLKVSEGWVRCGRCKEVFNALEGLFDLEREAPPEWRPPPGAPAPDIASVVSAPGALRAASPDVAEASEGLESIAPPSAAWPAEAGPDALDSEVIDSGGFADARFNTELTLEDEELAAAGAAAATPSATTTDEPPAPSFLREAERRERHRHPARRAAWAAAALALAAVLAAQWAVHFRDTLAAEVPVLRPLLATACTALGCTLAAPRRIEDIAVESSSLLRAAPGSDALKLVVALANRSRLALAMPWIDLTLTDGNGELIARRALAPGEIPGAAATLPPSAETSYSLLLANPGGRVAGYTVAVFYP